MHPSCDTRARKGISAARRFEAGDRFAKVRRPNGTLRCVGKRFSHHAARRPRNRKRDARRLVPDRAAAGCPCAPAVATAGGRDDGAGGRDRGGRGGGDRIVGTLADRKSVVSGKRVSVRVDLGGRRLIKKKKTKYKTETHVISSIAQVDHKN